MTIRKHRILFVSAVTWRISAARKSLGEPLDTRPPHSPPLEQYTPKSKPLFWSRLEQSELPPAGGLAHSAFPPIPHAGLSEMFGCQRKMTTKQKKNDRDLFFFFFFKYKFASNVNGKATLTCWCFASYFQHSRFENFIGHVLMWSAVKCKKKQLQLLHKIKKKKNIN